MNSLRKVIGALAGSWILISSTGPSAAQCDFCDKVITVDERLAFCFKKIAPQFLAELDRSGKRYVKVNLGPCVGSEDTNRNLQELPNLPKHLTLKSSFLLDKVAITCVVRLLNVHDGGFEPTMKINFLEQCGEEKNG